MSVDGVAEESSLAPRERCHASCRSHSRPPVARKNSTNTAADANAPERHFLRTAFGARCRDSERSTRVYGLKSIGWRPPRCTRTLPRSCCARSWARWSDCPRRSHVGRAALELADIFRAHGPAWRVQQLGHLSLAQLKVMSAIEQCRTAALGGHLLRCEGCGTQQISYNSCRNRFREDRSLGSSVVKDSSQSAAAIHLRRSPLCSGCRNSPQNTELTLLGRLPVIGRLVSRQKRCTGSGGTADIAEPW